MICENIVFLLPRRDAIRTPVHDAGVASSTPGTCGKFTAMAILGDGS
jgi:hypothetical protein